MAKSSPLVALLKCIAAQSPPPPQKAALLRTLRDDYGALATTGTTWRLTYAPEWWDARRLARCAERTVVVAETASTNDIAKQYPPMTLVVAEHQTAGRGRLARRWLALPGDAVLLSFVAPRPPQIDGLSVAVGATVWQYFGENPGLRLKWPNDLLNARGGKIAGILAEVLQDKIIIGVGLNRTMTPALAARIGGAAGVAGPAGLDSAICPMPSRHECADIICRAILQAVRNMADGFSPFRKTALRACITEVGGMLRIDNRDERFCGFADDGALLTDGDGGIRRHISGEVSGVVGG